MKTPDEIFEKLEFPNTGPRTYCAYKEITVGGILLYKYTGEKITVEEGEPRPENTSPYVLMDTEFEDKAWYVNDEDGTWVLSKDLEYADPEILVTAFSKKLEEDFNNSLKQLNSTYPKFERDTWTYQVPEAKAVLAGEDSPMFTAMAEASGKQPRDLALQVYARYQDYTEQYGKLLGEQLAAKTSLQNSSVAELLEKFNMSVVDYLIYMNRA